MLSPRFLLPVFLALGCSTSDVSTDAKNDTPQDTEASTPSFEPFPVAITPGESIGDVSIGMTYEELVDIWGEPDQVLSFQRTITLEYRFKRVEVLFTSSNATELSADARIRALGTMTGATVIGDLQLGIDREALSQWGAINIESEVRSVAYLTELGLGVKFDANGLVERYAVWPAYELDPNPPKMIPASTERTVEESLGGESTIRYEANGTSFEVVDMHLHVSEPQSQVASGIASLLDQLPTQAVMYFPATATLTLDPYGQHLGIKSHLEEAGVAHGVILSTYTHHTIGFAENSLLESMLNDPRNTTQDGSRWAWGMASINFDDFDNPAISTTRLAALASYFEKRPDLFIGIKLAHAHQGVSFNDPLYTELYDIAATHDVPVLLHTGFSPFPNTMTEPEYYDPASLESVVQAYEGKEGGPKVNFVLSHVGQGDARAIEHSLAMAEVYDNVWLELSAINRPLLIDADGNAVDSDEAMHTYVLSEIKARGLIQKSIFATDGPQYFGKVQAYLKLLTEAMVDLGYNNTEIQAVLADNFYRCYRPNEK